MLRRLRQTRISLAAKCQLLFGAAVTLIIAAALWVPWGRMDQLTQQLNQRSAEIIVRNTLAQHVLLARQHLHATFESSTIPTTQSAAASASTQPAPRLAIEGDQYVQPRLIGVTRQSRADLTRFENAALLRFIRAPNRQFEEHFYLLPNGHEGYRFAQPVFSRGECLACHAQGATSLLPTIEQTTQPTAASIMPTSLPTTMPALASASSQMPTLLGIVSVDIPSQIDSRQLLLNRVFMLSAGAFAGSLAIVIFWLITTRLILQPVRVLQETAEKVSQGDLNIRSDINTGDEFQQLSETFNIMLVNLKRSADQLRAANKTLDLKLDKLAESNVTLNESNRLKSEFLANVSHELRTPLNSILGFADLLRDQVPASADGKATRYVQNIVSSGNNLLDLINDLLDLAKIEAGKMEIRVDSLSLGDVFEGLANLLKPLLEPKQLTIDAHIASDVPIILTDATKLQQILYNFLSNAIKFSPVGGVIGLNAGLDTPERVRISVTDHGPGIEPSLQSVIFEKFRQIDGSVTRTHSGTGLGLAISRELAMLLGGSVKLRSVPGEGATFWITLPMKITSGVQDVRLKL